MSGPVKVDVLVVGSGAAGLSAAVTAAMHGASVMVAEKASVLGGTSAWSGGWLWIPRNPLARAEGIDEAADAPLTYLQHEMGGEAADIRLQTFLRYGPEMVEFFHQRTAVQFLSGHARPFPFPPTAWLRTGYLQRGNTLAELAKQCAIDANALAETVERFNHFASAGEDVDFHRGASAYNRAQGDHQVTLGPLREGPFYAVRILPGSLGTFSGLQTDEHARVLDEQQQPIPGLYAIGNDMSSVMRGYYPSGGITLGPAMTFGYLVGKNLAKKTNINNNIV
ncbi:FAD-dependent oxidoreductase [Klebsiella pneumoniae]|nr:FAD-dependent oxidoreductase [Klebsiella pneumoniae]